VTGGSLPDMRTLGRFVGTAATDIQLPCVIASSFGVRTMRRSSPDLSGTVVVAGLKGPEVAIGDHQGIARMTSASTDLDAQDQRPAVASAGDTLVLQTRT